MSENSFMLELNNNTYFRSLPVSMQENIKQSGVSLDSEDELKQLVQNLLDTNHSY